MHSLPRENAKWRLAEELPKGGSVGRRGICATSVYVLQLFRGFTQTGCYIKVLRTLTFVLKRWFQKTKVCPKHPYQGGRRARREPTTPTRDPKSKQGPPNRTRPREEPNRETRDPGGSPTARGGEDAGRCWCLSGFALPSGAKPPNDPFSNQVPIPNRNQGIRINE